LYTIKKTSRKPSNKNLGGTSSNSLLADSDNNYNKDKLDIVDPQLIIKDIAVSLGTFNIGDDDDNYVRGLMKLKLPPKFC
jgi:hypothetical protein